MYVILATIQQLKFCYLPLFVIISSVHGAFSLPLICMPKNTGTQTFLLSLKVLSTVPLTLEEEMKDIEKLVDFCHIHLFFTFFDHSR